MYSCPYINECLGGFREQPLTNSYLRVFHASPNAPAVDVYINNSPILKNLAYKQFSEYMPVQGGTYNIKLFPAGTERNPVISKNIFIPSNSIITAAAIGKVDNLNILPIEDKTSIPLTPGKCLVRFVHLSPDAPAVDLTDASGKIIFKDVKYTQVEEYVPFNAGTHSIQLRIAGTDNIVLRVPRVVLRPRRYYTIYAVGLVKGTPPLQVLIPLDGNTYLKV